MIRALTKMVCGGALVFGCAVSAVGCGKSETEAAAVEEIRAYVRVVPVGRGDLERTLELVGTVEAGRSADLVPDLPGRVKKLNVSIGDKVREGQVLARLDTEMATLQLRQARTAVKLTTLGLRNAEREFARAKALYESGSLPGQQFEQAQAGLDMARLQLEQTDAASRLAQRQVRGGVLKAPFDGVVSRVACEAEETYNPMGVPMGGPVGLVGIVDMRTIKIDVQVGDRDISLIQKGMSARIFVDALGSRLPAGGVLGEVEYVGKVADAGSQTFPVRIRADNPNEQVLIGVHARIHLVLERREDVLYVPEAAFPTRSSDRYVMVLDGERARRVTVTTGLEGDKGIEILEGVDDDSRVIVEGNYALPDGAQVEVAQ